RRAYGRPARPCGGEAGVGQGVRALPPSELALGRWRVCGAADPLDPGNLRLGAADRQAQRRPEGLRAAAETVGGRADLWLDGPISAPEQGLRVSSGDKRSHD